MNKFESKKEIETLSLDEFAKEISHEGHRELQDIADRLLALGMLFEAKEEAASTKLEAREWYGLVLLFNDINARIRAVAALYEKEEVRFAQALAELESRLESNKKKPKRISKKA